MLGTVCLFAGLDWEKDGLRPWTWNFLKEGSSEGPPWLVCQVVDDDDDDDDDDDERGRRKEEGGRRKEECFIRGRGTQFFDVSCRYHRFLIIQRGLFGFEAECGGRALRGHGIGFSETNCSPDPRVFVSAMSDVLWHALFGSSSKARRTQSAFRKDFFNAFGALWIQKTSRIGKSTGNELSRHDLWNHHGNAWNCKVEGEPMHVAMDREWWTPQRKVDLGS